MSPTEIVDGVARASRSTDVSIHCNYGGHGFDKMKLARIEREVSRSWLRRFFCRLFDCYREARD